MDGECGGLRRRSAVASAATAEPLPDRLTPVDDHRAVEVPGRGPRCGFSLLVACAPTLDDVSFTVTWHGWRQWLARGGTDTLLLLLFTFLALTTRLVSLAQPDSIAWDETHFGKFANEYINSRFYFDVHPPLAKMLIAAAGSLTGYDGKYDFKEPGQAYGTGVHYVGMRVFCAVCGAACIPLVFLATKLASSSSLAASLAATLVLADTSVLTISRFILLDPILMLFIMLSFTCMLRFRTLRCCAFCEQWWGWLLATGVSLGCVISCKFVGLFVVLLVGLNTVDDLWALFGDLRLPLKTFAKHVCARIAALIVLPVGIYLLIFFIHFSLLTNAGPGDGFMSSSFQTTLRGNELYGSTAPAEVAYGSVVSLKNHQYGGGLLHSHPHLYPDTMVQQQQITAYLHKDQNNHWLVKPAKDLAARPPKAPVMLRNGDTIRLEHVLTRRNLHSHAHPAPVTVGMQQVTGYGENGTGDINDEWQIIDDTVPIGAPLTRMLSVFRLLHGYHGISPPCALFSHATNLPKWGFEQNEVACNLVLTAKGNYWNFEAHINANLPVAPKADFSPGFWSSLVELHHGMFSVNSNLKPKEHEVTSRPWQWPINWKGQRFTAWGDNDLRVYLIGNPVVFGFNLLWLIAAPLLLVLLAVLQQRRRNLGLTKETNVATAQRGIFWLFVGWMLHFAPFFLMGRVLYFHHYMPAVLFSSMLSGTCLDFVLRRCVPARIFTPLVVLVIIILGWSFATFRFLSYGMVGPLSTFAAIKWQPEWEIA